MRRNTGPLKVSIDMGSGMTRVLAGVDAPDVRLAMPTAYAHRVASNTYVLGKDALACGDAAPVNPLRFGEVFTEESCVTFLRLIRQALGYPSRQSWAILSSPSSGKNGESEKLARLAGLVFQRALVMPGLTLTTVALHGLYAPRPHGMMLIDLGETTIKAALLDGSWTEPEHILHFRGGGLTLDARLERALRAGWPGLRLKPPAVKHLRERYASFAPMPPTALVQIVKERHKRIADIGAAVHESTWAIMNTLVEIVGHVAGPPGSPPAEQHTPEVFLTGGAAHIAGIDAALRHALNAAGYPTRRVIVPETPHELAVKGGWRVAGMLTAAHWDVLV